MIRGTTPTITLTVDEYDLTDKSVEIYIREKGDAGEPAVYTDADQQVDIRKTEKGTSIFLRLSQEDTLAMKAGKSYQVQVRWIGDDGQAEATEQETFILGDIMVDSVIEYRGGDEDAGGGE